MLRRLCLALALAVPAHTLAALEVSSTQLRLPATQADGELWLRNPEAMAWSGEARLYRWEQQGADERLLPADGVALSPGRLQIGAGQRQRLRVVRLRPAPVATQQAYRLVISPTPGPQAASAIRYSLPVFLDPPAPLAAALQVKLQAEAGQPPRLWLYNAGNGHAQLADLVFIDAGGQRHPVIAGLAGYVLAGRQRLWPLPARAGGYGGGHFQARLQDGRVVDLTAPDPAIAASAPSRL
ncbi:fimbrial biogenesis chaperone [Stenotrophomonas sp. SMYL11]|uniref:fimbrial biogenesis chaperone n=1 Tax=Stenotrophomonas sp. SMYL11 TaxID=3076042 RepID=UPI002E79A9EA|nr:fimbria/pilus periplasmic chaperone [Stenotrophomonas sp. SMYL11]